MIAAVTFDTPLDREFDYILPPHLAHAVKGARVKAPFGPRIAVGIIVEVKETSSAAVKLKEITAILDEKPYFSPDLFTLAKFMQANYGGSLGQILFSLIPFYAPKFLNETRFDYPAFPGEEILKPTLFYGCGADSALKAALSAARNGQSLVLTPDIMFAEELKKKVEADYGVKTFIWHSKVLESSKKQIYAHLLSGKNALVLATRSGALLPFTNLNLTVMFNEEDADYKQEENRPFFHARDVLLKRTSRVLFVTQSPSLEVCKMINDGKINLIKTLTQSAHARVTLTPKRGARAQALSDTLLTEIRTALDNKEKILLLFNRKSGAEMYSCLNCGLAARCEKCGGVLAETDGKLKCQKCAAPGPAVMKCPKCQNMVFTSKTTGGARVLAELKKEFPKAEILRLDAALINKNKNILEDAAHKENTIILATDAALKAFQLRPFFSLVAFVDADMELNSPDFRAAEKLCSALFKAKNLLQNAASGRLVIQTDKTDNPLFTSVVHEDYFAFAKEELEFRECFNFPPFTGLIKLVLQSKTKAEIDAAAAQITALLKPADISGPVKTGKKADTLNSSYLLIKTENVTQILTALKAYKPPKTLKLKPVANPYGFF